MSRFDAVFDRCRKERRAAIMPYITGGDPSLAWTEKLIDELVSNGADMIELGVPYSDPLADGPTVQAAGQRALAAGTTIKGLFDMVSRVRERHTDLPIALLLYYNCIFQKGESEFMRAAAQVGIDGLIVPDLPPEEAGPLMEAGEKYGVGISFLAAPTSTPERLQLIATHSTSFIYCVSLTGVTGARQSLSDQLQPFIARIRESFRSAGVERPLAVGFGISTPDHVRRVGQLADGVIVGSALIDRLHQAPSPEEGIAACGAFLATLRDALPTKDQEVKAH